jgi:hypothetical protein
LTSNPIKFATQLGNFIGSDVELITKLLDSAPKNAAKSADWYRYQRFYMSMKNILPSGLLDAPLMSSAKHIGRRVLDRAIDGVTSKQPSRSVKLSDYDRQRIEQAFGKYIEEVREASRKLGHEASAAEGH